MLVLKPDTHPALFTFKSSDGWEVILWFDHEIVVHHPYKGLYDKLVVETDDDGVSVYAYHKWDTQGREPRTAVLPWSVIQALAEAKIYVDANPLSAETLAEIEEYRRDNPG
jgi:hypothetical protein